MPDNVVNKPGDRFYRPRRITLYHLRRALGVWAVFSAGYGNVGSSIYYALGIVAMMAAGATPFALGIAGLLFIFTALTYAEGTSLIPEAGGSASFTRHAFGNTAGFTAGWALMLSYIVTISISAYTIPPYLGFFWEPLKTSPIIGTFASIGIIFFLMTINVIGIKETSFLNISVTIVDLLTQISLVVIGFITLFNPAVVLDRIFGSWPSTGNLVTGIALATIAYTGVETMSQMAEETKTPEKSVPRALILMIVAVLVVFAGISLVSLSAMPAAELASVWARDPVAGIANYIPIDIIRNILKPLIAVLAGTILLIAANAGIIGISRLAFSQGTHGLVPSAFGRVHHRFKTPYISIIVFCIIAIALLVPGFFKSDVFSEMGALYAIGSLLAFMFAHISIICLRVKQPDAPRPFRLRPSIDIKGYKIPLTAIIGLLATFAIWVFLLYLEPYSRWVGLGWVVGGLVIYLIIRLFRGRKSEQDEWQIKRIKE
jgi:APA family basic amino acid/polyamine antiporter